MKRRKLRNSVRWDSLTEAFRWLGGSAFKGYLVDLLVALVLAAPVILNSL